MSENKTVGKITLIENINTDLYNNLKDIEQSLINIANRLDGSIPQEGIEERENPDGQLNNVIVVSEINHDATVRIINIIKRLDELL